jgi:hypothetical protein
MGPRRVVGRTQYNSVDMSPAAVCTHACQQPGLRTQASMTQEMATLLPPLLPNPPVCVTHPLAAVLHQQCRCLVQDGHTLSQALQQPQVAAWQEHMCTLVLIRVILHTHSTPKHKVTHKHAIFSFGSVAAASYCRRLRLLEGTQWALYLPRC